ncbi:hypothetical protein OEZ85_004919 [Tetradesmus obliquus]|uniref:Plastid lipid-associated protein/fibrillin conserved domain-containing protein n=1 Tax=Tetradesmus obliquus TaxID=3088 RepID=A0ABY8UHK9_TETOB|nr:hypothetical protein OEZ85_004919 [Tetradesmus obliquus]
MQNCFTTRSRVAGCAAPACISRSISHRFSRQAGRNTRSARVQATAAVQTNAELLAAAQKLAQLSQEKAEQAAIDQQTDLVSELSQAAGTNVVLQEINDGTFKGYTLSGQTAQRFSSVITLGVLSFNLYQPKDLKIKTLGTDSGGVFKGRRDDTATAYVITTPFEVVEQQGEGEGAEVTHTGIKGRSLAIGEYALAADNPQRLTIKFKKMRLEPASVEPAELQRWLDTFAAANPSMDPATGVMEVDLPAKSPEGWMDYLMMTPEFQLVQGNFGSKTLLQRV